MRVVFMGTPEFAVPSLRALADEYEVVAVYSRPDAVSGRGGAARPSPIAQVATELALNVQQPSTLRDAEAQRVFAGYEPDVCVVAAYGLILPPAILSTPPLGCVNVHASLLPRWRGAAPVQRAILAGDTITGVSIMRMEEGLDTGPYCATVSVEMTDKNASALTSELGVAGAAALVAALPRIETGTCTWIEQDEAYVTYAAKLTKPEVALSPGLSVQEAVRRVRASSPQAPSRAAIAGRGVTVTSVVAHSGGIAPGSVAVRSDGVALGLADGAVRVATLKPDGKREMSAGDWARGVHLEANAQWVNA